MTPSTSMTPTWSYLGHVLGPCLRPWLGPWRPNGLNTGQEYWPKTGQLTPVWSISVQSGQYGQFGHVWPDSVRQAEQVPSSLAPVTSIGLNSHMRPEWPNMTV